MKAKILFTLFLTLSGLCSIAQWKQTNGPYNIAMYCIVTSGDTIFAGTNNGVAISADNGKTWMTDTTGMGYLPVLSLAKSGDTIFAGTENYGIYLSTDKGMSWESASQGLGFTVGTVHPEELIRTITISGNNVFAIQNYYGTDNLYLSKNHGKSWATVKIPTAYLYSLAAKGPDVYVGSTIGIIYSGNRGTSWKVDSSGMGFFVTIYSVAASHNKIFAGNGFSGYLYESDTTMTTWVTDTLPFYATTFSIVTKGDTVYAGTDQGVFISINDGVSWQLTSLNASINSLAISGSTLYASAYNALYISSDNGFTWATINNIHGGFTPARSLSTNGNKLFAGTEDKIYTTSDSGTTWLRNDSGLLASVVVSFAKDGNKFFAGTDSGLYVSLDNGTTWAQDSAHGLPGNTGVASIAANARTIIITSNGAMYVSRDTGISWALDTVGLPKDPQFVVNSVAFNSNDIFAGTTFGIIESLDYGNSWITSDSGLPVYYATHSIFIGSNNIFANTYYNALYISGNNGVSWSPDTAGLPPYYLNGYTNLGSFNIYSLAVSAPYIIAGSDSGIYISLDNGHSWKQDNAGFPLKSMAFSYQVNSLAVSGSEVFAGTQGSGIWKRPLADLLSSINEVSNSNFDFNIYPNPAGNNFIIAANTKYKNARIEIYNLLGSLVYQSGMDNQVLNVKLNAPAGIYIVKLQEGNTVQTKKLIIQ